jgi:hypothetical protein
MRPYVVYLIEDDRMCKVVWAETEGEARRQVAEDWLVDISKVDADPQ